MHLVLRKLTMLTARFHTLSQDSWDDWDASSNCHLLSWGVNGTLFTGQSTISAWHCCQLVTWGVDGTLVTGGLQISARSGFISGRLQISKGRLQIQGPTQTSATGQFLGGAFIFRRKGLLNQVGGGGRLTGQFNGGGFIGLHINILCSSVPGVHNRWYKSIPRSSPSCTSIGLERLSSWMASSGPSCHLMVGILLPSRPPGLSGPRGPSWSFTFFSGRSCFWLGFLRMPWRTMGPSKILQMDAPGRKLGHKRLQHDPSFARYFQTPIQKTSKIWKLSMLDPEKLKTKPHWTIMDIWCTGHLGLESWNSWVGQWMCPNNNRSFQF